MANAAAISSVPSRPRQSPRYPCRAFSDIPSMSDLTVLVSPTPLYPKQHSLGFNFARQSQNDLTRPVMITLENVDTDDDGPRSPVEVSNLDTAFLSPPRRTFKASKSPPPQRPASAPPLTVLPASSEDSFNTPPIADVPRRVFSPSTPADRSELSRPPPPLCECKD